MIAGLIPHRYAKALYKVALENGNAAKVYDEMKRVVESFQNNSDLEKVLSNPYVDAADKETVLLKAAGENPGDDYQRFVKLFLDHKREEFAYLMALAYRDISRKLNNISQVKTTTAVGLPESEMQKLRSVVEKSFADTTFEYSYELDPEIIGGFIIDVDSTRMDASMRCELAQLLKNILSN